MFFGADDLGDGEILQPRAGILDAFDFQSDAGELVGDGLDVGIRVEMFFQPGEREFHGVYSSPPSWPLALSSRRSSLEMVRWTISLAHSRGRCLTHF